MRFEKPVIAADVYTYDYESITQFFVNKPPPCTGPMRIEIGNKVLLRNRQLISTLGSICHSDIAPEFAEPEDKATLMMTISPNCDLVVQYATISANYELAQGVINSQVANIRNLTLALGVISGAVRDAQGIASEILPASAPSPTPEAAPSLDWQLPDWDPYMHEPEWDGDSRGPPTPESRNQGPPTAPATPPQLLS
jgi:hypothetical protein